MLGTFFDISAFDRPRSSQIVSELSALSASSVLNRVSLPLIVFDRPGSSSTVPDRLLVDRPVRPIYAAFVGSGVVGNRASHSAISSGTESTCLRPARVRFTKPRPTSLEAASCTAA